MFIRSIETAVCDTDMLGHVNNTRLPVWFEIARNDIFHIFNPDPEAMVWNLLTARVEIDYIDQIYFPYPVDIRSWISRIGNSSFTVAHELSQRGKICAKSLSVLVHVDPVLRKSVSLPAHFREALAAHLIAEEKS